MRELAERMGVAPEALEKTVEEFNAAVQPGEFDPTIKDGKRTEGVELSKSNWALPLDSPPFYGFAVTCGITFTFGGMRDERGRPGAGQSGPADKRLACRRRARRWPFLPQLPWRKRVDLRCGVRAARGDYGRYACRCSKARLP